MVALSEVPALVMKDAALFAPSVSSERDIFSPSEPTEPSGALFSQPRAQAALCGCSESN